MKRERKVSERFTNSKIEYEKFLDLLSAFEFDKFDDGDNKVHIDKYASTITVTLISTKDG